MLRTVASVLVLVLLRTAALAASEAPSELDPYLFRLEHGTRHSDSCVLLQRNGAFHLEVESGETTRVFEGALKTDQLQQVEAGLKSLLEAVSRQHIEEPLLGSRDLLKLDIVHNHRWAEVRFLTAESQEPYRQSLQPMTRWLDDLHKLPHKELSEDAGKNNCLAPTKIALKKRSDAPAPAFSDPGSGPSQSAAQPSSATAPARIIQPLLRAESFGLTSGIYHQDCALVLADGSYRAEDRSQKTGSRKVETRINGGKLTPAETAELQSLLSDSALTEIRHHPTSRLELAVSGEMLELKIPRPSGLQDIVLSSTFNRPGVPFFYSGDGDIARAHPLLSFLTEHVDVKGLGSIDPQLLNGCTDAP